MKNNNNFNKNVNSVDTNEKNNNGDDFMKTLSKKEFKALSKGQAYNEYENVGEIANTLKLRVDEAEILLKDAKNEAIEAQKEASEAQKEASEAQKQASEAQKQVSEAQKQAENAEARAEEAELRALSAEGKADGGLDLVSELRNDLDDLVENRNEEMETYNRLGNRMTGKINRANINSGTIRHYRNIIDQCKKDIEAGKDVGGNKATINELEAEIRNLQRQVEAAKGTFNEMKYNKTIVSQKIDAMDDELNKRYVLNNLLCELGYI